MATIQEAADGVKGLRRYFQSVLTLADAVDEIGGIEQAAREAKARLEEARKDELLLDTHIASLKAEVEEYTAQKSELHQKAKLAYEQADAEAAEILKQAEIRASDAFARAEQRAGIITDKALAEAEKVNAETAAKLAELKGIKGEILDKQAELESVEAKLAAAKEQIAKLLG